MMMTMIPKRWISLQTGIAELLPKSIYIVTAGDLGTSSEVEETLSDVERAA